MRGVIKEARAGLQLHLSCLKQRCFEQCFRGGRKRIPAFLKSLVWAKVLRTGARSLGPTELGWWWGEGACGQARKLQRILGSSPPNLTLALGFLQSLGHLSTIVLCRNSGLAGPTWNLDLRPEPSVLWTGAFVSCMTSVVLSPH